MDTGIKIIKGLLIALLLLPSLAWGQEYARMNPYILGGGGSAADYCASQTWNTFTAFRLDFDHTTDTKTACLVSGSQVGVDNGSSSISNPSPVSPGSGGNAILPDESGDYIHFDNSASIFKSEYGEIKALINYPNNSTTSIRVFHALGVANQDYLSIEVNPNGFACVVWEDHNRDILYSCILVDLDSYYGKWAQVHVKWDTTRCASGACNVDSRSGDWTQAGDDELCIRIRVDANADGDFADGGVENWSAWSCDTNNDKDLQSFASEPGQDSIRIGYTGGTYDYPIYVDDVEISVTQPSE